MAPLTQFTHDGLTFDVRDAGPRDGQTVVLLHGFPQDSTAYDRVAPVLHQQGYRTLAPDQRGYSPRARPRGSWRYRIPQLVGDVVALLDAAHVFAAHVVGHDWGAGVAWELARRHPERVLSLTALSVPHPAAMVAAAGRPAQARRSWYMAAFQVPVVIERALVPRLAQGYAGLGVRPDAAARYARRFGTPGALTGPVNWYRALKWAAFDGPGRRAPRVVTVPTLYVWGNADPYVDRSAAELCERFVGADYHFVELDAGHWLPENHAGPVAALIVEQLAEGRGDPRV